ncbi:MAG: cupin domain-containing protein, partial [Psittacicella sp.]
MKTIFNSNITVQEFYDSYWQKKPLFLKNVLESSEEYLSIEDVLELAQNEDAVSRLLAKQDNYNDPWTNKTGPFNSQEINNLPKNSVMMIQNTEAWSSTIGDLWNDMLNFIPSWLRDDIMGFYTSKDATVGKHYDDYDVFLLQLSGNQRWQLGKKCDQNTEYLENQPIKIFTDMGEIILDEVMEPGDILYIPRNIAHYGVGINDGTTLSFGLRSLSTEETLIGILRSITSQQIDNNFNVPINTPKELLSENYISENVIKFFQEELIRTIKSDNFSKILENALGRSVTDRRYDMLEYDAEIYSDELLESLEDGMGIKQDLNTKITYTTSNNLVSIFINGEFIEDLSDSE